MLLRSLLVCSALTTAYASLRCYTCNDPRGCDALLTEVCPPGTHCFTVWNQHNRIVRRGCAAHCEYASRDVPNNKCDMCRSDFCNGPASGGGIGSGVAGGDSGSGIGSGIGYGGDGGIGSGVGYGDDGGIGSGIGSGTGGHRQRSDGGGIGSGARPRHNRDSSSTRTVSYFLLSIALVLMFAAY